MKKLILKTALLLATTRAVFFFVALRDEKGP
jgi:hypothetical protein